MTDFDFSPPSSTTSSGKEDEVDFPSRARPYWPLYNHLFRSHGFRLDTIRDAKEYYRKLGSGHLQLDLLRLGYLKPYGNVQDDDTICPDYGLPDNLFRGTRIYDGKKIVVKAVGLGSREHDFMRLLSTPPLRDDPMNHTIPVLNLIEVPKDNLVFIVMEQWSSHFMPDTCCLKAAVRQCIEHVAFIHRNHIAHLDISMHNLVTDYEGHYAFIDYELSRRFDGTQYARVSGYRGTEVPPEIERGESSDPYKIDVWALGTTILRACKTTGHGLNMPELLHLLNRMMCVCPEQRPTASSALMTFDTWHLPYLNPFTKCSH